MANSSGFFSLKEDQQIIDALKAAELRSGGEVRVHLENKCKPNDPVERAIQVFDLLKMSSTDNRNGVLFYMAIKDQKYAVIGDVGIDSKVPKGYWAFLRDRMQNYFIKKAYLEGLLDSIEDVTKHLEQHFPYPKGDTNELSDELSIGS